MGKNKTNKNLKKMDEDENVGVSRSENVSDVSIKDGMASLQAIPAKPFRIGSYLQGVASKTIAFIAIATNTIRAAIADIHSSNDLDAIFSSDGDSDYPLDSVDKRIYRNVSINTVILKSMQNVSVNATDSLGDSDSGENVTMASLGNNLLAAAVTSTFNIISFKPNDSAIMVQSNFSPITEFDVESTTSPMIEDHNNYWALSALLLVACTAAGNILVCMAISWERRLQNVTNYFLMSLAITDLMVAILVMPLGILSLVKGEYKIIYFFSSFFALFGFIKWLREFPSLFFLL